MLKSILFFFFAFTLSLHAYAQTTDEPWDEEAFLRATSLVGGSCEAQPVLYRAMGDGIYRPLHMVANFLGDETKEIKSWGLQALLNDLHWDGIDLAVYHRAKTLEMQRVVEKKKNLRDPCKLEHMPLLTVLGQSIEQKLENRGIGIASSNNEAYARGYAFSKYTSSYDHLGGVVFLMIHEKFPRAGFGMGIEYYFPVVLPARDITEGCTKTFCYQNIGNGVDIFRAENEFRFVHSQKPDLKVLRCSEVDDCKDSPSKEFKQVPEIAEVLQYLREERRRNPKFRYKMIVL